MAEEGPVVQVEQGALQGRLNTRADDRTYYSFQGIPYAKPPLGSLRFKAPLPAEPWEGVRDATSEGNISAQIDPFTGNTFGGDENCLFLNVYTPTLDGEFLPVMFFIHGGAFAIGSGNAHLYGPDFLVEKDVVLVTINYRCGALGFLSLNTPEVPGNAGLKDVVQALKWVKENIHNFGGNSGNITVFGESAGGIISSILTASPASKGLFQKVIIQSSCALNSTAFQNKPVEKARKLAKQLGCDSEDVDDIMEFLTATSVKDLIEAQNKVSSLDEQIFQKFTLDFAPVVEKEFPGAEQILTEPFADILTSGRIAQIPVMIGSTTLEFAKENWTNDLQVFIPEELNIHVNTEESIKIADQIKQIYFSGAHIGVENLNDYFKLLSDRLINIGTHRYIQHLIKVLTKPVYFYKFDYIGELNLTKKLETELGLDHAGHMDELGYLFTNMFQKDVEPTPQDIKMRERMVRLWTNFAKIGNPTPDESHHLTGTWQPVTKEAYYYMLLGAELSLGTNYDKEKMDFWDTLYSKYYKIWDQPSQNTEEVHRKEQEITEPMSQEVKEEQNEENAALSEHSSPANPEPFPANGESIVEETNADSNTQIESSNDTSEQSEIQIQKSEVKNSDSEVKIENINVTNAVSEVQNDSSEEKNANPEVQIENPEPNGMVVSQEVESDDVQVTQVTKSQVNGVSKQLRTSNEIKMAGSNGVARDVIRANDPPEDDRPKDFGVNKFVSFFESLGGKKN